MHRLMRVKMMMILLQVFLLGDIGLLLYMNIGVGNVKVTDGIIIRNIKVCKLILS
jgi:hypothetical protein